MGAGNKRDGAGNKRDDRFQHAGNKRDGAANKRDGTLWIFRARSGSPLGILASIFSIRDTILAPPGRPAGRISFCSAESAPQKLTRESCGQQFVFFEAHIHVHFTSWDPDPN